MLAEIYGDVLNLIGATRETGAILGRGKMLRKFIDKGLRAQKSVPNFVTNQVNVTIDFFPDRRPPGEAEPRRDDRDSDGALEIRR